MTREELKQAALSLPYEPGVYLMKNAAGTVIYVGKAKKLKNRVSQYFQDTAAHNAKTRKMVSNVDHFETIAAATEFEALVLECSLIKHYMPKYNILLKDDKGFPYVRLHSWFIVTVDICYVFVFLFSKVLHTPSTKGEKCPSSDIKTASEMIYF